jgi:hypothetical protein
LTGNRFYREFYWVLLEPGGFEPLDVWRKKVEKVVNPGRWIGGAGGIRTPYLLRAKQTFSQVNYGPLLTSKL